MRALITALFITALATTASAHEGHDKKAKTGTLTGEVIDITCYLDHESSGEKHAACAQKCITAGNPVGILANDIVYVVVMGSHESPNAKLAPFAGKMVKVTGKQIEKDGIHAIDLETIAPADPAPKK